MANTNKKFMISNDDIWSSLVVLRKDFFKCLLVIGVVFAIAETGLLPKGIFTSNSNINYILSVAGIILALGSVFFGLKLFAKFTKDKDFMTSHFNHPMLCYRSMSNFRLTIIGVAICFNILSYYFTKNNNCLLVALIPFITLFFCWPTRGKLENYIHFIADGAYQVESEDEYVSDDTDSDGSN